MIEIISFPKLGLELEINRVAFTLFGQNIYWYGIIFGVAFVLGTVYAMRRARMFGVDADRMLDVLLGGVVGGIIGARLYYVAFRWEDYSGNLMSIFNIREGGMAMYGSIIGAALAIHLMCRLRRVKFLPCVDVLSGGLLLAQAVGRWGNFVNIEAFGTNTDLPWAMTSPSIVKYLERTWRSLEEVGVAVVPYAPVHPTFLYESLWNLAGFIVLALYSKRRKFDGEVFLIYLGWYGLGRFFIEGLRTDSLMLGALRISQVVAILCFITCVTAILAIRSSIRRAQDPEYLRLYVETAEGQSVLDGTFYPKSGKKQDAAEKASESDDTAESESVTDGADGDGDGSEAAGEESADAPGDESEASAADSDGDSGERTAPSEDSATSRPAE